MVKCPIKRGEAKLGGTGILVIKPKCLFKRVAISLKGEGLLQLSAHTEYEYINDIINNSYM
jgi:hypothetical protein